GRRRDQGVDLPGARLRIRAAPARLGLGRCGPRRRRRPRRRSQVRDAGERARPLRGRARRGVRLKAPMRRRAVRVAATTVVSGLCVAYILWKIDVGRTAHILGHADAGYFVASLAIMVVTVWPMAWRWRQLLGAKGIEERLPWLTRAYFVAYTAGQVLPTS